MDKGFGIRFVCAYLISSTVFAATPIVDILLKVSQSNIRSIFGNSAVLITYIIKNNTSQSLRIQLEDMPSVFQAITEESSCRLKQRISPHGFCLLNMVVAGQATSGPVVSASSFWKTQAKKQDQLLVSTTESSAPVTLSVAKQGLALSVNNTAKSSYLTGNPRSIVITNTSTSTAYDVQFALIPGLGTEVVDATIESSTGSSIGCGYIPGGGTCTLTVTPGQAYFNGRVMVWGKNTNLLSFALDILDYGSIYEAGYVFDIEDDYALYPSTESVGGKVVSLQYQAPFWPLGIVWTSNGVTTCERTGIYADNEFQACTSYYPIPGIDENSRVANGDACDGNTDGRCDTNQIIQTMDEQYPNNTVPYAAQLCTGTIDGYSDWYLPAICELGSYIPGPITTYLDSGCTKPDGSALLQNMVDNLHNYGLGHFFSVIWSSTQSSYVLSSDDPRHYSWSQYFFDLRGDNSLIQNIQTHDSKEDLSGVRCVRAITQPPTT